MKRLLLVCGLVLLACQALIVNAQSLSVTYYHTDALGSVVAATDENGDLRWKKSYLAYGQAQGDDHNDRFGYTGHTEESDGLVYTGARYYHPGIGRFISPDPVGFLESNTASFNRYAYANNNPYRYTDPNGQLPIIPIVIGVIKVADIAIRAYDVYSAAQSGGALGAAEAVAENVKYNVVPGGKIVSRIAKSGDTVSDNARQALRKAKEANRIPKSAQPDRTIKPNTPEGNQLGLDNRNVKLYEYTNSDGHKIHIRHDKTAKYGQGGVGDQSSNVNAGNTGDKLKQHHYHD